MARRILVVYYSMTGHTRRIAEEVVAALNADCEEIREPRKRHGLGGVIRALFDALTGREPPIEPVQRNPNDYDLLVLGGPVWARRMASPVRSYARKHAGKARQIAFLCTEGGSGAEQAFDELQQICRCAPSATLAVDATQLKESGFGESLRRFVSILLVLPNQGG
ncbi:MAG: hypothetical protein OQK79_07620 [Rhodanobacter sp.]|jgi:flavodoxin|nr:hypothetical protein [Rhodanobacter sp.]